MKITVSKSTAKPTYERRIHEMANKWRKETGLPMNIWLDESQTYLRGRHSKRIKFQLDRSDRLKPDFVGSMDLDGNIFPRALEITKLRRWDLKQLRNFVHNNRHALEMLADMKVWLASIWDDMIKGGELATEEQIQALDAKVDKAAKALARRK